MIAIRLRTAGLLAVTALALGLGTAACGDGGEGNASEAGPTTAVADRAVQYTQCMRQNGLPSFPDPVNGQIQLQISKGGELDPSSATFQTAQKACKALEPAGLFDGQQSTGEQDKMLKFVKCMRDNGVPEFPDPSGGNFKIGSGIDPNSPAFQKAMAACRSLIPGGAVTP